MIKDFLHLIVRPTLRHMAAAHERLNSVVAEQLMLGTPMAESAFREIRQQPNGPALTFFQIEPATRQDIDRYLERPDKGVLCAVVDEMRPDWPVDRDQQIVHSMSLACAYARIKYWMVPKALPKEGDIEGLAEYYLTYYATSGSAANMSRFVERFREFVSPLYP